MPPFRFRFLLAAVLACALACEGRVAADRAAAGKLHQRNAEAALARGDFPRALLAAQLAATYDPLDPRARDAILRIRLSQLAQAPQQIRPDAELDYSAEFMLERDPANAATYLSAQVWLRLARGDKTAAEAFARKAVAAQPSYGPAHLALGQILLDARRADEAAAELSLALERDPKSFAALLRLGRVELLRGHNQRAAELLKRAVDEHDDPGARMSLGVSHWNLHHPKEAGEELQRAVELEPGSPDGHLELANYFLLTDRDADAQREFETAGRLGGGAPASLGQGLLAMRRRDFRSATKLFEQAASDGPRLPQALYQAALAHENLGEPAIAAQLYQQYLIDAAGAPEEKQRLADAAQRLQRLAATPAAAATTKK